MKSLSFCSFLSGVTQRSHPHSSSNNTFSIFVFVIYWCKYINIFEKNLDNFRGITNIFLLKNIITKIINITKYECFFFEINELTFIKIHLSKD